MSKTKKIIVISVSAALFALFVLMLLLSLPLGGKMGVLPILSLYVTGIVVGVIFLFGAIFSFVLRARKLTKREKGIMIIRKIRTRSKTV